MECSSPRQCLKATQSIASHLIPVHHQHFYGLLYQFILLLEKHFKSSSSLPRSKHQFSALSHFAWFLHWEFGAKECNMKTKQGVRHESLSPLSSMLGTKHPKLPVRVTNLLIRKKWMGDVNYFFLHRIIDDNVLTGYCARLEDWILTAQAGDEIEFNLGSCKFESRWNSSCLKMI